MITTSRLSGRLLAFVFSILFLGLAVTAKGQHEDAPYATRVTRLRGKARFSTDNHNWRMLRQGDMLRAGSLIQTAGKGTVDLQFGDASSEGRRNTLRIFEDSILYLTKLNPDENASETQLDLRSGRVVGHVGKLTSACTYQIKIANGFAGTHGAAYALDATGQATVVDGSLVVVQTGPNGALNTKVVKVNQRFDPACGEVIEISTGDARAAMKGAGEREESGPAAAAVPAEPPTQEPSLTPTPPAQSPLPNGNWPTRKF